MTRLNKLQIDTAAKLLKNTLQKKAEEIAKEESEKAIHKFDANIVQFNKKTKELYTQLKKIKKQVEKNPKLQVDLEGYNNLPNKLTEYVENPSKNSIISTRSKDGIYNEYGQFIPDFDKENEEIERFILNLQLGTALMADLDKLLDKINKLK